MAESTMTTPCGEVLTAPTAQALGWKWGEHTSTCSDPKCKTR